jgi:CcmD family protein
VEKGYDFLFWAYNVIWIAIAAYVTFLVLRLGRVRDRLDRLERRLQAPASAGGDVGKPHGS